MNELVTIKHREYGTVEGVTQRPDTSGWEKFEKGRLSFFDPEQGWALVIEPKWITIEVKAEDWNHYSFICLYGPNGTRIGEPIISWRYPSPKKGQAT